MSRPLREALESTTTTCTSSRYTTSSPATELLPVNTSPPTKVEVPSAINLLKCGKAAGPDGVPPEALRTDAETTADMLTSLLQKVWKEEKVLGDWMKGYLVKLPKKGDLSHCKNWRGITLLPTPSKILSCIILERLRDTLDSKLRPEQAGWLAG
ncbi:unnamed protein product [Heterobilharzia americana]|nr:unnamed protein product [Heterobilharzia americana]